MLGCKVRNFMQHESISLENLVPKDNFFRQVEQTIDLSFVRDLAGEFYSNIGRPSIDPVVFFKLQHPCTLPVAAVRSWGTVITMSWMGAKLAL